MSDHESAHPFPSVANALQGGERRRSVAALCAAAASMNTAMIGASAIATLFAADTLAPLWSGAPNTAGVLGTAAGTLILSALMLNRGRRAGLLFGYGVAVVGAALGVAGILSEALPLVLAGMLLLGVGNGGAQLSRYAAAELYPRTRQGFGLGAVVWAGTIGAVAGSALISPSNGVGAALQIPPPAGVFLLTMLMASGAWLAASAMPRIASPAKVGLNERATFRRSGHLLGNPRVKVALASMVTGQLTMVAVMTMTPLHIHQHGHGLDTVGIVLGAHTLGMTALSPLSGWLADRHGPFVTIICALGMLALSTSVAVLAPTADGPQLTIALFLLGFGWNLGLVGGSALLSHDLDSERTLAQGIVDALAWGSSAVASLVSGMVFAFGGYSLLGIAAGAIVVYPAWVLTRHWRAVVERSDDVRLNWQTIPLTSALDADA